MARLIPQQTVAKGSYQNRTDSPFPAAAPGVDEAAVEGRRKGAPRGVSRHFRNEAQFRQAVGEAGDHRCSRGRQETNLGSEVGSVQEGLGAQEGMSP